MMGQTLFTAFLVLFWVSEFVFASIVVYWFVTQGFSESDRDRPAVHDLEPPSSVRTSLVLWAGFFAVLVGLIVVGA